ncbi:MAG: branched-chain amino acid ABC transporter substrate-binding protein [Jatrophihabitantaceae bacterium]
MPRRTWTTIAVVVTASALALTGCSNSAKKTGGLGGGSSSSSSGTSGSSSSGGGAGQTYKIGFEGPLSGANAQLGINEEYGAELAVDQANASGKLAFKLQISKSDDEGDPAKSPAAATQLVQDPAVLGVIGPSFSGSTAAVGSIYSAAGLTFITPSATNATLGDKGWKTYHRIVPNDNVEGSQGADWLARKKVKKLFVLQDLSTYGKGVGDTVAKEATAKGIKVTEQGLDGTTTKNYNPIAQTIVASGDDALFYGGYDAQAALLAKALQSAGFKGLTVTGNGGKSSVFTQGAGPAGNGWYFTCGCQDATVAPAATAFTAAYQQKFNTPPSTYSPEAFDATNALIEAIKTAASSGTPTRSTVESAVNGLDYHGITTEIKFQANGEVVASAQTVNLYEEKNGKIVEIGNIKDQS